MHLRAIASPDNMYGATFHRNLDTLQGGGHVPDVKNIYKSMQSGKEKNRGWELGSNAIFSAVLNLEGEFLKMSNLAV